MRGAPLVFLALLASVALAVGGGRWFLEWATEEVEVEGRGEPGPRARANPHLALARSLDALGIPTRSSPTLALPPEAEGSLALLFPPAQRLSVEQVERLLAWVERGGALVVALPPAEGAADPLYQALGIESVGEALPGGDAPDSGGADPVLDEEDPRDLRLIDGLTDAALRVEVSAGRWLQQRGGQLDAVHLDGVHPEHRPPRFTLAAFERGEGHIVALADASPLDNQHLDQLDHAPLALALVPEGTARALVIYRVDDQDLLDKLWDLAAPAVISGLALVLVWLWAAWGRFGPLKGLPPPARRSLLEHVDAAGAYLWRQGEVEPLLEALRAEVLGAPRASPEAIEALARRLRRDPADLTPLFTHTPANRRELTELVLALAALGRDR